MMPNSTLSDLRRRLAIARQLPQPGRGILIRTEIEIYVYAWWCRLVGRRFRYPVINRMPGVFYRTTKSIPGMSFRIFGKAIVLLEPVVLEEEGTPFGLDDRGNWVVPDAGGPPRIVE